MLETALPCEPGRTPGAEGQGGEILVERGEDFDKFQTMKKAAGVRERPPSGSN
jgi:hypothetical protein